MRYRNWSVQEAKNRFREFVEAAPKEPQTAIKRPTVVVITSDKYENLRRLELLKAASFADHLLAMPTDDGTFERIGGRLREPPI